jgi:flagellar hook-length control protein FliK
LAVRPEKTRGRALPTPSSPEALKTAELPVKELKPAAPKTSQAGSPQAASPAQPLVAFAPQRQVAIAKATPATPSAQLAQLMLSRAPEPGGTVKAELTLYPEHLGVVQVQLSVDPSGALSAVVFASAQAIDQLGVADLRSALQGAGLNLQDLDLRRQNKRQFEQGAKRSAVTLSEPQTGLIQPQAHIQGGSYLDMNL